MISVIIPHYPFSEEINQSLKDCLASFVADEIIIVSNQGTGFAKNVNLGLKIARGDYLIVLNNDVQFTQGKLQDLCTPGVVTSPKLNFTEMDFVGACFCLPREVYEKIGPLDEQFEIGYYEDDDYQMRLKEANIPMRCVPTINIQTLGGATMKQFNQKELGEINGKKFKSKWNLE